MPAYLIVNIHVTDAAGYEAYKTQAPPLVAKYGGRYLVRGGPVQVIEGEWEPERLVVLEFPDEAAAKAFLDAPEYAPVRKLRQATTDSHMILMQGAAQ